MVSHLIPTAAGAAGASGRAAGRGEPNDNFGPVYYYYAASSCCMSSAKNNKCTTKDDSPS